MRNKIIILFSLILVTLIFITVCFATNPVVTSIYTADPAPMVYDGKVYLYTGHDENNASGSYLMKDWRCFSSSDMVNWTDHGAVLSVTAFSWAGQTQDANAAQVIYRNGKFYYYVAVAGPGGIAIGVASSTSPTGPFTDARGSALVTYAMTNFSGYATHTWRNLDPTVFIDDDGQAYLYWGNNGCYWARLNSDMISLNGSVNYIPLTTAAFGQDYEEAPWIYKRNGLYYLLFAAGFPEWIAYSTSSSPTGPWTYRGVIMPKQGNSSTNHPGVIDFNGNSYFCYHNSALPGGDSYHRSVCIEKFNYNADGTFPTINMTTSGVGTPGPTPTPTPTSGPRSAFSKIEAESYNTQSGIQTESCGEGGQNIGFIENGDYAVFNNIDFGSGATSFQARVASANSGGNIEIRLDSTTGALLGTCAVTGTGGWQTWVTATCNVSGVSGIHNLYLRFTGGSGYLFNMNWFQFFSGNVTPTPTPTPGNLIANLGMETGNTSNWAVNGAGTIAVSTAQKHSGTYSLLHTGRTATWNGPLQNITSKVQSGKTYACSGWIRLDNATSGTVIMTIKKVDGSGTAYTNIASATGSNSSWVQLSGNYSLTVSGTLTELSVYFEGPASGINYYVDDVSVQ